jgi:predicted DNA-binding transcriptional regulator YafY
LKPCAATAIQVTAAALAEELGVSVRTISRDIQTLCTQGATIEGEAGLGYLLKPGFLLPPLMFAETELEALGLGMRWVAQQEDTELARAARQVLAKVMAVLPPDLEPGHKPRRWHRYSQNRAAARHGLLRPYPR